ncbi:DODA-type extradiol aromatic ring-opening family dioxygenase [Luteibacter sp. UNCMF366Tsu5.1]|uniref:DODA-type extradiol aromatic ring-opening family dioxygenase n=1 Tax=Luteibacter sp. UNCMF366Tsu5.1 TaxID=1502758 RepID=UPI000908E659|nr:class III extradiol ring-cleavage dioxygenase [Luteibacter sp. UNCMF366Tsu5.1]SFW68018.1 Aromatic ring-opening dioxygenase, catalytic subunit, LigB family [Luteibacter sp. UNCMF366Tsu5.1]
MFRAPAIFVSHGAPTFALEPGLLGSRLTELGERLASATAIAVVSPHWQTCGIRVTGAAWPSTMHDFGGFPAPLYSLTYPAPGSASLASEVAALLIDGGFVAMVDTERGLDHGAWVPLRYLRPDADTPVIQVSMPHNLDTRGALRLGRVLAGLRDRGIVVMGSGSLTHNLHEVRRDGDVAAYARDFAGWVRKAVTAGDVDALLDYRTNAPSALRAHPTEEHYLPLLVAVGAAMDDVPMAIDGGITYGVLSMDCFAWGVA